MLLASISTGFSSKVFPGLRTSTLVFSYERGRTFWVCGGAFFSLAITAEASAHKNLYHGGRYSQKICDQFLCSEKVAVGVLYSQKAPYLHSLEHEVFGLGEKVIVVCLADLSAAVIQVPIQP